mgnify:CR=1 FL=1
MGNGHELVRRSSGNRKVYLLVAGSDLLHSIHGSDFFIAAQTPVLRSIRLWPCRHGAVGVWRILLRDLLRLSWKFGRRATGLIMAASLFALKLGAAFGGALAGWVLSGYGFVAGGVQTPEALQGILLLVSWIPGVFGILGFVTMLFYSLTSEKMKSIETDLIARKAV